MSTTLTTKLTVELAPSTWNPPGTPEIESDDTLPSKAKEPVAFYALPKRAGDRGRTGDVQLGKLDVPGGSDPDESS